MADLDLKKLLRHSISPKTSKTITAELRDDLESIAPGTMHQLTTASGQEFAVVRLEDFELLLQRAYMGLADE